MLTDQEQTRLTDLRIISERDGANFDPSLAKELKGLEAKEAKKSKVVEDKNERGATPEEVEAQQPME